MKENFMMGDSLIYREDIETTVQIDFIPVV